MAPIARSVLPSASETNRSRLSLMCNSLSRYIPLILLTRVTSFVKKRRRKAPYIREMYGAFVATRVWLTATPRE